MNNGPPASGFAACGGREDPPFSGTQGTGRMTPNFAAVPPWADTTSPSGRMVMTIFVGIAEFKRTLILSRTTDGRLAAKARGVAFGRPRKMRPGQQELARELVREGKSISAVARTFDVHPATIYRVIEG
jgi:DNA invertase Pin-like site-specific DNA recombinase